MKIRWEIALVFDLGTALSRKKDGVSFGHALVSRFG